MFCDMRLCKWYFEAGVGGEIEALFPFLKTRLFNGHLNTENNGHCSANILHAKDEIKDIQHAVIEHIYNNGASKCTHVY